MKIIDRYLLRQFVQVFIICFLSLYGLYVVFDAFSNLDEFIRYAEKEDGNLLAIMCEFYVYRMAMFLERISGILVLIAAMFTVTWIQRHNELTALLAAGISKVRVVAPVLIAATVMAFITASGREFLMPRIRDELSRTPKDLRGDNAQKLQPRYDHRTYILLGGTNTYRDERRIESPSFLLPPEMERWGSPVTAANALYQPPQPDRPGGYLLKGVTVPANVATKPSLVHGGQTIIITPHDDPDWLKPDECFVVSDVDFDQLVGGQTWRQFSSTREMVAGLSNPSLDFGADMRVAIHTRLVQPFTDLTLLMLGLPLVLTRENRNIFLAIGMCVGVVCVFMMVLFAAQYLGTSYLISPALAAWIPLIVFVPVAVWMFDQVLR